MLPNDIYHLTKRDRFRDTAEYLRNNPIDVCYDSNVQNYFYSTVHEAERYLWIGFNEESRGHGRREAIVNHYLAYQNRQMVRASRYNHARHGASQPVFDAFSQYCYMTLTALRKDVVYGEINLGAVRHANGNDVEWARRLYLDFVRSVTRHERNLRRLGFI